jgi:hypothetical protein
VFEAAKPQETKIAAGIPAQQQRMKKPARLGRAGLDRSGRS